MLNESLLPHFNIILLIIVYIYKCVASRYFYDLEFSLNNGRGHLFFKSPPPPPPHHGVAPFPRGLPGHGWVSSGDMFRLAAPNKPWRVRGILPEAFAKRRPSTEQQVKYRCQSGAVVAVGLLPRSSTLVPIVVLVPPYRSHLGHSHTSGLADFYPHMWSIPRQVDTNRISWRQ